MGSKGLLAPEIVERIPDHVCYVEPFAGAARVFFRKEPSKVEVLNDLDGELVNFWRVVQNHHKEFIESFRFAIASRKMFEWEQARNPRTLTDIQRAARFFYVQQLSYGGRTANRTMGYTSFRPPYFNVLTLEERITEIHNRMRRALIENLDACQCIRQYDHEHTFFYLDPPYLGVTGYEIGFTPDDYVRLRDTLQRIKGRFIPSLNDDDEVRALFGCFKFQKVETKYYIANARTAHDTRKKTRHELLIHNLEDPSANPVERFFRRKTS